MDNKSNIPQFTGAEYNSWASKIQYALIEKNLHSVVFDFRGTARKPCPAVIGSLTQAEIDEYFDLDLKASIFLINHLDESVFDRVARAHCELAFEMWNFLNSRYGECCKHCGATGHELEHCHKKQMDLEAAAEFAASSENEISSFAYSACSGQASSSDTDLNSLVLLDSGTTSVECFAEDSFSQNTGSALPAPTVEKAGEVAESESVAQAIAGEYTSHTISMDIIARNSSRVSACDSRKDLKYTNSLVKRSDSICIGIDIPTYNPGRNSMTALHPLRFLPSEAYFIKSSSYKASPERCKTIRNDPPNRFQKSVVGGGGVSNGMLGSIH